MSNLRTAAWAALEALGLWATGRDMDAVALNDLIFRLEAALAEPVQDHFPDATKMAQEPGVWIHPWPPVRAQQAEPVQEPVAKCIDDICSEHLGRVEALDYLPRGTILFTTPPQPTPLTVERLRDALVASRIVPPAAVEDPDEYDDGVTLHRIEALHRRLA